MVLKNFIYMIFFQTKKEETSSPAKLLSLDTVYFVLMIFGLLFYMFLKITIGKRRLLNLTFFFAKKCI